MVKLGVYDAFPCDISHVLSAEVGRHTVSAAGNAVLSAAVERACRKWMEYEKDRSDIKLARTGSIRTTDLLLLPLA